MSATLGSKIHYSIQGMRCWPIATSSAGLRTVLALQTGKARNLTALPTSDTPHSGLKHSFGNGLGKGTFQF